MVIIRVKQVVVTMYSYAKSGDIGNDGKERKASNMVLSHLLSDAANVGLLDSCIQERQRYLRRVGQREHACWRSCSVILHEQKVVRG